MPNFLTDSNTWEAATVQGGPDGPPEPHTHPQSDIVNLTADLAAKAAAVHTHAQSDITGLTAALAGKSDVGHTHPPSGGDIVYVPTCGDTAVNNVADVTIVTRNVTGVLAGDQIIVEGAFTILNNSAATRVYVITVDFDGLFDIEITTGALAFSATLIHPFMFRAVLNVRAANLAYAVVAVEGQLAAGIASGGDTTMAATHLHGKGWGTTTSDATGTCTVALKVRSANATATQTLRLHQFTIRKVSPT